MLVECIEQSEGNAGFRYDASRDGAEQTLAGKWVGMVLRHYLYTKGPALQEPRRGRDEHRDPAHLHGAGHQGGRLSRP